MRELSLDDINKKVEQNRQSIDYAVNKFRAKTRMQDWNMKRIRPRHPDEIKTLNYIGRSLIREALRTGEMEYDKESRVFKVAKYIQS